MFLARIVWEIAAATYSWPYRIPPPHQLPSPRTRSSSLLSSCIVSTGFFFEGPPLARDVDPGLDKWSFVGYPLASIRSTVSVHTLDVTAPVVWAVHVVAFSAPLDLLTTSAAHVHVAK